MNGMRILIQHRQTKLFFKSGDSWVESEDQATCFSTPFTALQFSNENHLGDTEVLFIRTAAQSEIKATDIVSESSAVVRL